MPHNVNATPISVRLDRVATEYFGDEWAQPLSHFSKVNARTLQRIRQAARAGEEHKSAAGAIAALDEANTAFAAAIAALMPLL